MARLINLIGRFRTGFLRAVEDHSILEKLLGADLHMWKSYRRSQNVFFQKCRDKPRSEV